MLEAETLLRRLVQPHPIAASLFEQGIGADDIALDESAGPVYRAVDMAFSRQMKDSVGAIPLKERPKLWLIANVHLSESITRVGLNVADRVGTCRIGQLVDV